MKAFQLARPVALVSFALGCVAAVRAAVIFDAPGHVTVERSSVVATGGVAGASWALLDWRGRSVNVKGKFDGVGKATLPPLPTGYYRMVGRADAPKRLQTLATLAVVPDPTTRPKVSKSFYGVDCATSQLANKREIDCPWNGGDRRRTAADLAYLAGFTHVRDRMGWSAVQTSSNAVPDFAY